MPIFCVQKNPQSANADSPEWQGTEVIAKFKLATRRGSTFHIFEFTKKMKMSYPDEMWRMS